MTGTLRINLSDLDVRDICKDIEEYKCSISDIAKKYGVRPNIVRNIANRKTHKLISKDFDFTKYNNRDAKPKKPYTFFSEDVIVGICEDLQYTDMTLKDIGKKRGVSDDTVDRIYQRKSHTDISRLFKFKERKGGHKKEHISDDLCEKICQDISENKISLGSIAKKYNVSLSAVFRIFHGEAKLNISKKYDFDERIKSNEKITNSLTDSKVADICSDLQNSDMNLLAIARKHNVSPKTVHNIYYHKTHTDISKNYKFRPEELCKYVKRSDDAYSTSIDTIYDIWNSIVLGNSNREYIQMMKKMLVYGYRLGKSKIDVDLPDDFYKL